MVVLDEGDHAVAVSDDLAAGDLRCVGDHLVEMLVGDPLGDELGRLVYLLLPLEQAERAEDPVAGLDQVVAGEAVELAQLRDALSLSGLVWALVALFGLTG